MWETYREGEKEGEGGRGRGWKGGGGRDGERREEREREEGGNENTEIMTVQADTHCTSLYHNLLTLYQPMTHICVMS